MTADCAIDRLLLRNALGFCRRPKPQSIGNSETGPKLRPLPPGVAQKDFLVLCHSLCHNPATPARVGPLLAVSLRHTPKAVNVRETRMNTAFLCRSISLCVCPSRFALGNGMEEVIGSIPISTTNQIDKLQMTLRRSHPVSPVCAV